ncbi:MAG: DMT family transporter [Anaerolineaceae bacterium]|nr:DMT family transporter [Anaerolineaceae bacterium]
MKPKTTLPGHLAALLTITIWGITFINTKVLLENFTPIEIMFFRLVFGGLALTIVNPPRLAEFKLGRDFLRGEWKIMLAGLCGATLYFIFQNIALSYTLAANVSVLVSVAPLFTALVSRALLGEKLKTNFFLGFTAAIAGIILISFNGSMVLKLNPLGDLLCILAALVWAFYSVLVKQVSAEQGSSLAMTRKVVTYGLLFLLPLLPLFDFRFGFERLADLPSLLHLLFLGVGASALCYVTWNYAVHLLGPVKTSVYIYLVPLVTISVSVLVLREPITLVSGVGIALILLGMVLSEQNKKNPQQNSPPSAWSQQS